MIDVTVVVILFVYFFVQGYRKVKREEEEQKYLAKQGEARPCVL